MIKDMIPNCFKNILRIKECRLQESQAEEGDVCVLR